MEYVKNEAGIFGDEFNDQKVGHSKLSLNNSLKEIATAPETVSVANIEDEKQRKWGECLGFLRNNPKLLLQMLPDMSDDE